MDLKTLELVSNVNEMLAQSDAMSALLSQFNAQNKKEQVERYNLHRAKYSAMKGKVRKSIAKVMNESDNAPQPSGSC